MLMQVAIIVAVVTPFSFDLHLGGVLVAAAILSVFSVGVGGGGRESGQVRLTFDGAGYPTNPTVDGLEQVDPSAGEELIPEGPGEPLP